MRRAVLTLIAMTLAVGAFAVELSDAQRSAIEERIKPVGEVCLQGDSACGGPAVAAGGAPRSGKEVYDSACMACHTTGAAGAPMLGDAAAWGERLAQQGLEALHDAGINGVPGTGMIAKGGCVNCTDEEVIAAVDYMLENSK